MKKLFVLVFSALILTISISAQASVVPLADGLFEINYQFDLKAGTLNGSDVTDIFIFETNGAQNYIDYSFIAPALGPATISHEITFDPTLALLIGLDRAPANSGLIDHLVIFMDNDFAQYALTKPKFSDVFPGIDGRPRVGHNAVVDALKNAQNGDAASLQLLEDFFLVDAGKFAAFDPEGSFRVIEFTGGVGIDMVPEPASLVLLGSGLAGAFLRRRNKA